MAAGSIRFLMGGRRWQLYSDTVKLRLRFNLLLYSRDL